MAWFELHSSHIYIIHKPVRTKHFVEAYVNIIWHFWIYFSCRAGNVPYINHSSQNMYLLRGEFCHYVLYWRHMEFARNIYNTFLHCVTILKQLPNRYHIFKLLTIIYIFDELDVRLWLVTIERLRHRLRLRQCLFNQNRYRYHIRFTKT